eukprot:TRINITY_DN12954_c0_g1_i1.p1 TRINITY_DN12954_c0_g1~~TRINITY_DN12954_c0_g1_i1.p1  ORF type:complete len:174 (+),score=23.68 TRINITY_DN12954_c0_g1_i1:28-522(+)
MDQTTKQTLQKIPLLKVNAGPTDGDAWVQRLKEEYTALITYVKINKQADHDWFSLEAGNKLGTRWKGKCWYIHDFLKYEFKVQFEIPIAYPKTAIEIQLPELEGKTSKMYRGGKICLTIHFKPLWARNVPHFGIAHALAMGLAPWLAAEVPHLIKNGHVKPVQQ